MLHIFLTGKKSGLQAGQFKTLLLWSHFAVIDAICVLELSLLNMQGLFWKRCHLKATISKGTAIPSEMLAFTLRAVDKLDDPFFLLTCFPCSIENKTGVWEICKSHYLFYWHFRQCPNMFRNKIFSFSRNSLRKQKWQDNRCVLWSVYGSIGWLDITHHTQECYRIIWVRQYWATGRGNNLTICKTNRVEEWHLELVHLLFSFMLTVSDTLHYVHFFEKTPHTSNSWIWWRVSAWKIYTTSLTCYFC